MFMNQHWVLKYMIHHKKYCSDIKSNLKGHLHQPNHILYFDDKAL